MKKHNFNIGDIVRIDLPSDDFMAMHKKDLINQIGFIYHFSEIHNHALIYFFHSNEKVTFNTCHLVKQ